MSGNCVFACKPVINALRSVGGAHGGRDGITRVISRRRGGWVWDEVLVGQTREKNPLPLPFK